ncbi:MAG TPA: response regulator transcription factor [Ktedonobacteraceae bacterium]|nr:response regulator transcription factor [Ktedonobacteraceae bacterium]
MQGKRPKILVVDDDPDILDFLQDLLNLENYTVVITEQAEYLEQLHDGGLPDLILIDILLSGKDGREIIRHLKSQERNRYVPVIMFSAHPSAETTALEAGADDFLAKPFEMDELLAKIKKWTS